MINLSIKSGKYYSGWKISKIVPAYKNKGNRFEAKYYRPVSNLSEISKLLEKAVHDQVYNYLNENNLIHENHHGFLKHHSTATALQQLVDFWLKAIDRTELSAALLLDLSAGFDVLNIELLLNKLILYNFGETTMSWFKSYLMERSQTVQIESSFSELLSVPWGVPQGSILGPVDSLFDPKPPGGGSRY